MPEIRNISMQRFIPTLESESVAAIITSPPFIGLPGRGDTSALVAALLSLAEGKLTARGSIVLIIGSADGHITEPYKIISEVGYRSGGVLRVQDIYIWDRRPQDHVRRVDNQNTVHDFIVRITKTDSNCQPMTSKGSIVATTMRGFDYGDGVTTPPDLARWLVGVSTSPGDLVIDPFCGLGEIGVQAVKAGRRFAGCDIDDAAIDIAARRLAALKPKE